MRFNNCILLNAVANTGTKNSDAVSTEFMISGSFQGTFSSNGAGGTLLIQASNDPAELLPAGEAPQNWTNIASATATVVSGASVLIPVNNLNYRWVRASWTQSAGTGTVTVSGFLMGLG